MVVLNIDEVVSDRIEAKTIANSDNRNNLISKAFATPLHGLAVGFDPLRWGSKGGGRGLDGGNVEYPRIRRTFSTSR